MLFETCTLTRRCLPPGNYNEAEQLYHRALDIIERVRGENHPDTAASLNNLAGLLRAQRAPLCAMGHDSDALGMWSHAVLPLQVTMYKPQSIGMLFGAGTLTRRCLPPEKLH
jgi:hypothetical protein